MVIITPKGTSTHILRCSRPHYSSAKPIATTSCLSRLRTELRNTGALSEIINATKNPNITALANRMQAEKHSGILRDPGKPGVKWFNTYLKQYNIKPSDLRKIGLDHLSRVDGGRNDSHR
ncbi:16751_t:CDS:2 [Rhizophagus irregularis]|nr:16751_t:CDS:2 [Rhizophagus irregularis]